MLYRADWTRLSLSAELRFGQDDDLARLRKAAVRAEWMRRMGFRPGPHGSPVTEQEPDDDRGGYHRWRAALLIAPGRRYRLEYEGKHGGQADGSDGEQAWTLRPPDAAVRQWNDAKAVLRQVPGSARAAGHGGVGYLLDTVARNETVALTAASSTIRARVRSPLGVSLRRALVSLSMRPMLAIFEFDSPVWLCQSEFRNPLLPERARQVTTDLKDLTALVTGSTSGIGKATALALAARGARVRVAGRNERRARDVVAEIEGGGGSAAYRLVTLSDLESALDLVQWATEAGDGHVDIVISNAGVALLGPSSAATEPEFDETFALNVKVPFFVRRQPGRPRGALGMQDSPDGRSV